MSTEPDLTTTPTRTRKLALSSRGQTTDEQCRWITKEYPLKRTKAAKKAAHASNERADMPDISRVSLHPLTFEEALGALLEGNATNGVTEADDDSTPG